MPHKNPDLIAAVLIFLQSVWPSIAAGFSAFGLSFFRILYDGGTKRKALLEGAFVACIGAFLVPVAIHFGMPESLAGALGGLAGLLGVDKLRNLANRFLERQVDKT